MAERLGDRREMPDVPKLDLTGSLAEIWFQVSYAAYHMAYVRVYSQSELRTKVEQVLGENEEFSHPCPDGRCNLSDPSCCVLLASRPRF